MKVDFKIVCVVLLAFCFVAESEGWWLRRSSSSGSSSSSRSSSRSSSSSSRSSSSSSSSRRSSSRHRGWGFRRPRRPSPRSSRGFWFSKPKTTVRPRTTTPTKRRVTKSDRVAAAAARLVLDCKTQTGKFAIPSWIISILLKKPRCCIEVENVVISLIVQGKNKAKSTSALVSKDVFSKYVATVTTVERPFGDKKKGKYGKKAITCLHRYGFETSISSNPDRITHSGVLVTTEDGETYLIQKMKKKVGDNNTRVEYVKNFFDDGRWKPVKTIVAKKRLTVNDYYKYSKPTKYNVWSNNCHHATNWMAQLAG